MRKEKLFNEKKRLVPVVTAITAIAIIAGSLAYWNQTHTIENPFNTPDKYGSSIIEDFQPDGDFQPGVKVNKAVRVENTGDQDIIVRVRMDEKWVRKGEDLPYKAFAAEPGGDIYNVWQDNTKDGFTEKDKSVVHKNFSNSSNWVDGKDGWFYYRTNLQENQTTENWLESVELANDLDVGVQKILHYVTTDEKITNDTIWTQYDPKEGMLKEVDGKPVLHSKTDVEYETYNGEELIGYLSSNYTLTITTQTIQATKEAVDAIFEFDAEDVDTLGVDWNFAD